MIRHTFEVTTANFREQVLQSPLPVLVDFWAEWCPPCKMLDPIVDELADKHEAHMRVGRLDGDAQPDIIEAYGVMGLPTLILFRGGVEVERITGFKARDRIEAALLPHLSL